MGTTPQPIDENYSQPNQSDTQTIPNPESNTATANLVHKKRRPSLIAVMLGISLVVLFLIIISIVVLNNFVGKTQITSSPKQQNLIDPTNGPIPASNMGVDNFAIIYSAEVSKSGDDYSIKEDISPLLITEDEFKERQLEEENKPTNVRLDVIKSDGSKESKYLLSLSCLSDVCEEANYEYIPGFPGLLLPVSIYITPEVEKFEFYINDSLVKESTRDGRAPVINSFKNQESEETIELDWELDNENDWVSYGYLESKDKWHNDTARAYKDYPKATLYKDGAVLPIQSEFDSVDFRVYATDGFYLTYWEEKDFIEIKDQKNIDVQIHGTHNEPSVVGQYVRFEIDFVDPETGQSCGSNGCIHGTANGKYLVTWESDKQEIAESDVSYNGAGYKFEVPGVHTISVKVQHKDKDYIQAQNSIKVTVNEAPF